MTDRTVPVDAVAGRSTAQFTAASVPPALRKAHHTTVWAELIVARGSVRFVEEMPHWHIDVPAGQTQVIVPNRKHHVEPSEDAKFRVQFYDR